MPQRTIFLSLAAAIALQLCLGWGFAAAEYRTGDIIFQTSKSAQSQAVQLATGSRYSHMGLLLQRNGSWQVLEAAASVRYTPLRNWVEHGVNGHFVVKRLADYRTLDAGSADRLAAAAEKLLGRPYDRYFEWSDGRIYCSELVWKLYQRVLGIELAPLQPLSSFNLSHPQVRLKLKERYGAEIPLNEQVVSPAAIFESPLLTDAHQID